MTRVKRWTLGAMAAVVALTGAAAAETRIALLVGNQDYPASVGRLSRPHQDVKALGAALGEVGFEVATALDADHGALDAALDAFAARIDKAAAADAKVVAFFYYAGHGASTSEQGRRRNFLIPARAMVTTTAQLLRRGVALDAVIRALAATQAHAIFVVSDACRDAHAAALLRSAGSKGFGAMRARPGMFIASAVAPGETAPDDGAFADALAASLRLPGEGAEQAFKSAFRQAAATSAKPRPVALDNRLREPFCFNGCEKPQTLVQGLDQKLAVRLQDLGKESVAAAKTDDGGQRLYGLGEAYYLGVLGKKQDYAAAARHYRAACERGHARACNALGYLYDHGEGRPPNRAEAARYYKLACNGGNAQGCANLGILYRFGSGVTKDPAAAERYYRTAIKLDPKFEVPYIELEAMGLKP